MFVYLFTFLRICVSTWDLPESFLIMMNDKLVTPYLCFEINLNMACITSECTHFL